MFRAKANRRTAGRFGRRSKLTDWCKEAEVQRSGSQAAGHSEALRVRPWFLKVANGR